MLRLFLLFSLVALIVSCKKKGEAIPSPIKGTLSFLANDTPYKWIEETIFATSLNMEISHYGGSTPVYVLEAVTSPGSVLWRTFYFPIYTSSLILNTPFTYLAGSGYFPISIVVDHHPNFLNDYGKSKTYGTFLPGDSGIIIFTSLKNNRASGVFTARLSRSSDSAKINITDGKFENVMIW